MFCGIFTQSFDAFWGHSNILKINCKAVSTTASSISLQYQMTIQGHIVTLHAFQIELQLVLFAAR